MDLTSRLSLPLLIAGQSQKEVFHNEALHLLDVLTAGTVEGPPADDPPASPAAGSCFIVGASPTGEWASYPGHVAAFSESGWRFIPPVAGLKMFVNSSGGFAVYTGAGWEMAIVRGSSIVIDGVQVVGSRQGAIAAPSGGSIVDSEARLAVEEILAALRSHGLIAS